MSLHSKEQSSVEKDLVVGSLLSLFLNEMITKLDKTLRTTVKPVLSGHSNIDKTTGLKDNGSLMKVKSIAECSKRAFCNTSDLH